MRYNSLFITFSTAVLFYACGSKTANQEETTDNQLIITELQFKENNMAMGTPTPQLFAKEIACKGHIVSPPNAQAKVSSLISGKIATIQVRIGDYVEKGKPICTLSSTEFIDIQRDYAEAIARFAKVKSDYQRAKTLREENIGSEKDFITQQSEYNVINATVSALKAKLTTLKLNADAIEKGQFYTSYAITAPISGYITKISAVLGQFVDMTAEIVEVVDVQQAQLQLLVFESDLHSLKPAQEVRFTTAGTPDTLSGKLILVGKSIDPASKTATCIAEITSKSLPPLVNDSYVTATVITSQDTLQALPNNALVKSESSAFIYVLKEKTDNGYVFEKKEVKITRNHNGFSALSTPLPNHTTVITKGAETL